MNMVRPRIGEPRFTAVMRMADGRYLVSCNECHAVVVGGDDQWAHLDWHAAKADTLTAWVERHRA